MTGKISIVKTALCHKCPACGKGEIYEKLLEVTTKCSECGLHLKEHDAGDGPVFFAMFLSAIIITGMAFLVEVYFMIPLWLHVAIWLPVTVALSIFLLKIAKSWLICLQYRHNIGVFQEK